MNNKITTYELEQKAREHHFNRHRRAGMVHSALAGVFLTTFGAGVGSGIIDIADDMSKISEKTQQETKNRAGGMLYIDNSTEKSRQAEKMSQDEQLAKSWVRAGLTVSSLALMVGFSSAASRRFKKANYHKNGTVNYYPTELNKFKNYDQEPS